MKPAFISMCYAISKEATREARKQKARQLSIFKTDSHRKKIPENKHIEIFIILNL
jgi:hypothetical protein